MDHSIQSLKKLRSVPFLEGRWSTTHLPHFAELRHQFPSRQCIPDGILGKGAPSGSEDARPLQYVRHDVLFDEQLGVQLIEMVGSPHCRLHLDVKAMSSEAKPIVDIIRDCASHLEHFHANDANRRGPGMGEIDFVPILQTLKDIDYQGWVSVEVFDYDPGVEALAKESIDYLRDCLERIK